MALAGGYMPSVLAHPWSSRALYLGSASTFSRLMCLPESNGINYWGCKHKCQHIKAIPNDRSFEREDNTGVAAGSSHTRNSGVKRIRVYVLSISTPRPLLSLSVAHTMLVTFQHPTLGAGIFHHEHKNYFRDLFFS